MNNLSRWYQELECPASYDQIDRDLSHFPEIDMDLVAPEAVSRFSDHGRHSLCHYKIIDNKVFDRDVPVNRKPEKNDFFFFFFFFLRFNKPV